MSSFWILMHVFRASPLRSATSAAEQSFDAPVVKAVESHDPLWLCETCYVFAIKHLLATLVWRMKVCGGGLLLACGLCSSSQHFLHVEHRRPSLPWTWNSRWHLLHISLKALSSCGIFRYFQNIIIAALLNSIKDTLPSRAWFMWKYWHFYWHFVQYQIETQTFKRTYGSRGIFYLYSFVHILFLNLT